MSEDKVADPGVNPNTINNTMASVGFSGFTGAWLHWLQLASVGFSRLH